MTDARIEAAARALCDSQGYRPDGDEITPTNYPEMDVNWKVYEEEATIAITAADAAAWMPIETAPKDRTRIMIRKTTGHICVAFFDDGEWYGDDWYCVHHDEYITHWQPLPAPPDDGEKS